MKKVGGIALVAALFAASGAAQAAGVGVRAGTLGVGVDVGWSIAPTLAARVGYSALQWNKGVSTDSVSYNGKLKLSNLSALVDFSPLGPLRLTGGLVFNGNKYDISGQPSGSTYTLNGHTYSTSDLPSLQGTVKSGRDIAPYLGVGYGNVAGLGANFYADLGILFQGSPRASLNAACGSTLSSSGCSQLQADAAAEQARLEDKLKSFRYYPVLNVGLTIGF